MAMLPGTNLRVSGEGATAYYVRVMTISYSSMPKHRKQD